MEQQLRSEMRDARKCSDLKFQRFALECGFSESHLRNVENGGRQLTADVVDAYDRVLGTGGRFRAAFDDAMCALTSAPWDTAGNLAALGQLARGDRGRVNRDRRQFIAATGTMLTQLAGMWSSKVAAQSDLPVGNGVRKIQTGLLDHIDDRLDDLRHLDDELGSGDLATLAQGELLLLEGLLKNGGYTDRVGSRMYSLASEAGRQAAWCHFDQGRYDHAEEFFEGALRASVNASDPVAGAYALSFLAVQCYSTGKAQESVDVLRSARDAVKGRGTPRLAAMLAARSARAHSKAHERRACAHELFIAQQALDKGEHEDDPSVLYWVTEGEIEMIAGSSALDLGDPAEAIRRFDAALAADYRGEDQYPRSHAIYRARAAEAYLRLHDLDGAVATATQAVRCLENVDSARSSGTISDLRGKLAAHKASPAVRDFLDATRSVAPSEA